MLFSHPEPLLQAWSSSNILEVTVYLYLEFYLLRAALKCHPVIVGHTESLQDWFKSRVSENSQNSFNLKQNSHIVVSAFIQQIFIESAVKALNKQKPPIIWGWVKKSNKWDWMICLSVLRSTTKILLKKKNRIENAMCRWKDFQYRKRGPESPHWRGDAAVNTRVRRWNPWSAMFWWVWS